MQEYLINEIFTSIQGEGFHTGRPSVFIRFSGCSVKCSFCDTKYAMTPEKIIDSLDGVIQKSKPDRMAVKCTVDQLVYYMEKFDNEHIVLTGGEPFEYDIYDLLNDLIDNGRSVQVETSGCFEIKKPRKCWLTLSPKKCCHDINYLKADEIKFIIGSNDDFERIKKQIEWTKTDLDSYVYLQPEGMRKEMIDLCIEKTIEYDLNLSLQIHKLVNIK